MAQQARARYALLSADKKAARQSSASLRRLKTYGLTPEKYAILFDKQQGVCAICRIESEKLCVDHCHKTGVVRGLLCKRCNSGLGHFSDDTSVLEAAIGYLNGKTEETNSPSDD